MKNATPSEKPFEVHVSKSRLGFLGILTLLFVVAKLLGLKTVAAWSWWTVFSPVWVPIAAVLAIVVPIVGVSWRCVSFLAIAPKLSAACRWVKDMLACALGFFVIIFSFRRPKWSSVFVACAVLAAISVILAACFHCTPGFWTSLAVEALFVGAALFWPDPKPVTAAKPFTPAVWPEGMGEVIRALPTEYPAPAGYRRLRPSEILKEGDMATLLGNEPGDITRSWVPTSRVGKTVASGERDGLFFYRKITEPTFTNDPTLPVAEHPCPDGYRRLASHEKPRKGDLYNSLDNTAPYGEPGSGFLTLGVDDEQPAGYYEHVAHYRKLPAPVKSHGEFPLPPAGWRRVKDGEVVKEGDLIVSQWSESIDMGKDQVGMSVGYVVGEPGTYSDCAFYRKLPEIKHEVPVGWRRLEGDEIIEANDKCAWTWEEGDIVPNFEDSFSLIGTPAYQDGSSLVWYRKLPELPKASHPVPAGYRRLQVGEVVQSGDRFVFLSRTPESIESLGGIESRQFDATGFAGNPVDEDGAYYRKLPVERSISAPDHNTPVAHKSSPRTRSSTRRKSPPKASRTSQPRKSVGRRNTRRSCRRA